MLDIRYSNKLNVIQQCPKSSVENVYLKLTLRYRRNHDFYLHPFPRRAPFDSSASGLELHDRDIAFVNPFLDILGAAVGRIGE